MQGLRGKRRWEAKEVKRGSLRCDVENNIRNIFRRRIAFK